MRPYKTFNYKEQSYKVDSQGFLLDPEEWDENFAEGMAPKVGIPNGLTEEHWKVIRFIRNTFEIMKVCPLVYVACKKNDIGLGRLKKLFPTGYLRGVCKLSGVTYRQGSFQQLWLEENIVHHTKVYERKAYPADVHGFLINSSDWDENFAIHKAYEMKMPEYLTEKHWKIIYFLRARFEETGTVPTVYETCKVHKVDLDELERLFPDGYHRGAVKIAGLQAI